MAKSKGKVELQVEIKTQDQLDELLSKEGLIVVDAYSAWCGPCKAIVSSFKRLKNELGDDLLVFATAETDSIDLLEAYRMKSQPTFLFYAGGILVNVVRGCNCPLLIKTIRNELEKEHKVMDGKANRLPFVDQDAVKESDVQERKDEDKDVIAEEEEIVELPKQVTVAIIKPDAVKAGLVDEIIQKVEEAGMEVLDKEEKWLSKEEAAEFYKQHEGSEHFDQLVEFMSSGPCMTLVLSKAEQSIDTEDDGTIDYFRDLIGPKDVNIAKEKAPNSIRALYGTDTVMNAIHGCDSSESAARELAFFYPDFVAPKVVKKRQIRQLQRTLALIRPDALRTQKESILAKIQEAGFTIAMSKEITLTREQAEDFYSDHKDSDFFETLVTCMTSGPMMALCLAREDAVAGWRELLGPKDVVVADQQAPESFRSQFRVEDSLVNPLHGSDSIENAEKEIQHFFPMQTTVAVIKPEVEPDKREEIIQRIKEAGFKIQFEKELTLDKKLASHLYHEHEGKDFFEGLTDYMSSGPTLFMVLAREDAVSGWRAFMGPTDPQDAQQIAPYSLRAQFGLDKMKNAVHGSSSVMKAEAAIKELFPEVQILPNGSVKEKGATPNEVSKEDLSEEPGDKETDNQGEQQVPKESDYEVKPDGQVVSEESSEADKIQEVKTDNVESGVKPEFREEAEENIQSSERESSESEPKEKESLAANEEDQKSIDINEGVGLSHPSKPSENDIVDKSVPGKVAAEETKTTKKDEGGEESQTTQITTNVETKTSKESGTENNKTSDEGEVVETQTNQEGTVEKTETSEENEVLDTKTTDEEKGVEETGRTEEGGGDVNSNS